MTLVPEKRLRSPCKAHEARLSPSVRSPWDSSHAMLSLNDLSFGSRIFGWHGAWSSCSRYFAVTEWLRVDDVRSPDMQLVVIDVRERRECVVEHLPSGFLEPMHFHDDMIKYTKIAAGMEQRTVEHRRIGDLTGWRAAPQGCTADAAAALSRATGVRRSGTAGI